MYLFSQYWTYSFDLGKNIHDFKNMVLVCVSGCIQTVGLVNRFREGKQFLCAFSNCNVFIRPNFNELLSFIIGNRIEKFNTDLNKKSNLSPFEIIAFVQFK